MLTDDEINSCVDSVKYYDDYIGIGRAIIAAYTAKLRQGVELPEPFGQARKQQRNGAYLHYNSYTKDQLLQCAAAAAAHARVKALEDIGVLATVGATLPEIMEFIQSEMKGQV